MIRRGIFDTLITTIKNAIDPGPSMRSILYDLHNGWKPAVERAQENLKTERFQGFRCPVCDTIGEVLPGVRATYHPVLSIVSKCCNPGCDEHGKRFAAWYSEKPIASTTDETKGQFGPSKLL